MRLLLDKTPYIKSKNLNQIKKASSKENLEISDNSTLMLDTLSESQINEDIYAGKKTKQSSEIEK